MIMSLRLLATVLLFLSAIGSAEPVLAQFKPRTWTLGDQKVRATFVELDGDTVRIQLSDGTRADVPLQRLKVVDRDYARRMARSARGALMANDSSDWFQWRGPNRNGISNEKGLLDAWPAEGPPVAWKAEGFGAGYSSVSISEGRLYTMGKFGDDTKLIARDASNGKPIWESLVGKGGDGPNCTPTVDGDLVYALSFEGDLLCADSKTGKEVWRTSFPENFGGQMMSGWGYSESPLVDGDRLVVTPGAQDAMMAALNKRTGQVLWKTAMAPNPGPAGKDGAGYSSIVLSRADGVKQYVQLVGRGLIGVKADNGELLWKYNRVANGTANVPTPIVSGDFVFCSSGYDDGGSALLRLKNTGRQMEATEVWYRRSKDLQNHHGGMIQLGDQIYLGHGHNLGFPICFDWKSGLERWRPGRGAGTGSAAIVAADGHLYFRYENGVMTLIEATPKEYRLKGKFQIGINNGKSWPHPVIYKGHLYLRDQQELICYDLRKK
jgi:outer membrane protein assembly factor BamB